MVSPLCPHPSPIPSSTSGRGTAGGGLRTPTGPCAQLIRLGPPMRSVCAEHAGNPAAVTWRAASPAIFRRTTFKGKVTGKRAPGQEWKARRPVHTDLSEALAKHTGHAAVQPAFSHFRYFFSDPPSSSSSVISVAFFFACRRISRG